jgi:nicotinate-nucleotide pyrophosphorylase (carboxylating)
VRNVELHPPTIAIQRAVEIALAEDLLPLGDLTAALLDPEVRTRAFFVARKPGVLAGTGPLAETFRQVDPLVAVDLHLDEGARLEAGSVIATVEGRLASIVSAERTALNFCCHLSGVATLTSKYVALASAASPTARVWDTRKTTPGLRALEKAAVRAGGGMNHRGNLSEGVLVKDNHLGGLSIAEAVDLAAWRWPGRMIEVECDTLEQVREAAIAGATLVLCDNMTPEQVAAAVAIVAEHATSRCLVEASGGVDLETVAAYAAAGADVISAGALTHSAPILDIGLDLEPPAR